MPERIKGNKITFSDLETPKEKNKAEEFSKAIRQAQGFSDLFPIVEEHSTKETFKSEDLTVTATLAKNAKRDSAKKEVNNPNKPKRLGLYKTSSQIFDRVTPFPTQSLSTKNSVVETEYFNDKSDNDVTDVYLDNS